MRLIFFLFLFSLSANLAKAQVQIQAVTDSTFQVIVTETLDDGTELSSTSVEMDRATLEQFLFNSSNRSFARASNFKKRMLEKERQAKQFRTAYNNFFDIKYNDQVYSRDSSQLVGTYIMRYQGQRQKVAITEEGRLDNGLTGSARRRGNVIPFASNNLLVRNYFASNTEFELILLDNSNGKIRWGGEYKGDKIILTKR